MSKVTNNENMRRYVHMKLSNGGSGSSSGGECTCLSPMIVRGVAEDNRGIIPAEGSPTWSEAYAHMNAGGLVYFISDDGWTVLATYADEESILFGFDQESGTFWDSEDGEEGGEEGGEEPNL